MKLILLLYYLLMLFSVTFFHASDSPESKTAASAACHILDE